MKSNHRAAIGPPDQFDLFSVSQFQLLTSLGLREHHRVLDIGCGPLALGRLLIPYLLPGHYFAIEPRQDLIEEGVRFELGHDLLTLKKPLFLTSPDFDFAAFGVKFDFLIAHRLFAEAAAPRILACLQAVALNLQPNGLFLSSWAPGPDYPVTRFEALATGAGLHMQLVDSPHPSGQCWVSCFLPGCLNSPIDRPAILQLATLEIVQDNQCTSLDSMEHVGGYLLLKGCAFDPATSTPATQVLVAGARGEIRATIRVDQPRPDVAALLGPQALYCGFQYLLPTKLFGKEKLLLYAVNRTSSKAYLFSTTIEAYL
jgi:SAM-dependent methyltransferase